MSSELSMEQRLASIDENVKVIRRYCGYITFVIVFLFVIGVLGGAVNIVNA